MVKELSNYDARQLLAEIVVGLGGDINDIKTPLDRMFILGACFMGEQFLKGQTEPLKDSHELLAISYLAVQTKKILDGAN